MSESPKPNFRDPQHIIAIGVTIISLCALIVSVIQLQLMREEGEMMREHSRASVWPRLEYGVSKGQNKDDGSLNHFTLMLTNGGVGPAIITDVKVTYDCKTVYHWWDLFALQEIPDSIDTYITNRNFNKQVIKIEETIEVLNLDNNLPLANAFYNRLEDLSIDIYYKSIYGETWKYDGETTIKLENFKGLKEEEQFEN